MMQVTAVVTTPFFARSAGGVLTALQALSALDVTDVILLFDGKSKGAGHARSAFASMRPVLEDQGKQLFLSEVDLFDTGPRWRIGILEALRNPDVGAVFVFPGDLTKDPSVENLEGWKRMLKAAAPGTLVLGDYDSEDRFKTQFDELIGFPAIHVLFPELGTRTEGLGQSKLRTEFFVVGRKVFDHFSRAFTSFWGTDPTVQLILSTIESGALSISRVELGRIHDPAGQRHPLGQMHQVFRYMAQLTVDRMMHEMAGTRDPSGHMARYDELQGTLKRLFDTTLEALEKNRAELD